VYSASKAALEMLSEALQYEVQHLGVRVVIVQSGGIRTEATERPRHFSLDAYQPLIEQQAARQSIRKGRSRTGDVARALADIIEIPRLPQVPISEQQIGIARLGGGIAGPGHAGIGPAAKTKEKEVIECRQTLEPIHR
jgi:NAD(P)-dependent dehydrogenase (short-subunit alcohol dehydrogenase family)